MLDRRRLGNTVHRSTRHPRRSALLHKEKLLPPASTLWTRALPSVVVVIRIGLHGIATTQMGWEKKQERLEMRLSIQQHTITRSRYAYAVSEPKHGRSAN